MKLPFVSRERFDEMRAEKNCVIDTQKQRISDLEASHKRLLDLIFSGNFGVQLYGTIEQPQMATDPEESLTDEQKAEEQFRQEHADDIARLRSTLRTRPSQLGAVLTELMQKSTAQRAAAAHPSQVIFNQAKQEVTH